MLICHFISQIFRLGLFTPKNSTFYIKINWNSSAHCFPSIIYDFLIITGRQRGIKRILWIKSNYKCNNSARSILFINEEITMYLLHGHKVTVKFLLKNLNRVLSVLIWRECEHKDSLQSQRRTVSAQWLTIKLTHSQLNIKCVG